MSKAHHLRNRQEFHSVAVVGRWGTGKSTLIQTLLRLPPEDQDRNLREPRLHCSPDSSLGLWDTPGFDSQSGETCAHFLDRIQFDNYDFYLVTSSEETGMDFEKKVIQRILKQKKGYFYVYTKVDLFLQHQQMFAPQAIDEEVALQGLRAQIHPLLQDTTLFLVNCSLPDEFDFPDLQALLPDAVRQMGSGWSKASKKAKGNLSTPSATSVSPTSSRDRGGRERRRDQPSAASHEKCGSKSERKAGKRKEEEEFYNVGVVGKSGAGKSALINAYFNIQPELSEAAESDVVETTREAKPYFLPGSVLVLWDTPGFGTPTLPEDPSYFNKVHFDNYDFYILVSSTKVNEFEKEVCHRILDQNKSYFYVRTKMDLALRGEQRAHPRTFSEEATKTRMLTTIQESLPQSPVFLVDSLRPATFDFPDLQALAPHAAMRSRQAFLEAERSSRDSRTTQVVRSTPGLFCVIT